MPFHPDRPFAFAPYLQGPRYMPCLGPGGLPLDDVSAFKGHLHGFPAPSLGSYSVLDFNPDLCFERETRLGQYGLMYVLDGDRQLIDWDSVDWGALQRDCLEKNGARFDFRETPNELVASVYSLSDARNNLRHGGKGVPADDTVNRRRQSRKGVQHQGEFPHRNGGIQECEPRTAVLIRTYTSKEYTDDDKQNIRALVSELALRSGGEYQVFLLVHVKERGPNPLDESSYGSVLEESVPVEFRDMAILWDDGSVQEMYPELGKEEATVHNAQWLSVQWFMQEHREYDYVWN